MANSHLAMVIGAPTETGFNEELATPISDMSFGLFQSNESPDVYGMRRRWFHNRMQQDNSLGQDDGSEEAESLLRLARESAQLHQEPALNYFGHSEDRESYLQRRTWYHKRALEAAAVAEAGDVIHSEQKLSTAGASKRSRRMLFQSCAVMPLILSVWFSANAVLGDIAKEYNYVSSQASLLTVMVNIGFMVVATASAVLQIPDRVASSKLLCRGGLSCVVCNTVLVSPWPLPFPVLLAARFLTGASLSFIYPVLMRHVATWFLPAQRGLALGCVLGSLVLGIAVPSLIRALTPTAPWRFLVLGTSVLAVVGSAGTRGICDGPHVRPRGAGLSLNSLTLVLRSRAWVLATLSYVGHNLELFGGWAWIGAFLQDYFNERDPDGVSPAVGSLSAFAVIAVGIIGCVLGGILSDRIGRRWLIILAHLVSGSALASLPHVAIAGAPPGVVLLIAAIWGMTTIADSAQYSALISETLPDTRLLGSALALSLALGFASTAVGIYVVPLLFEHGGWEQAFPTLSLGALFGILAMGAMPRPSSNS